jgi:hypothetical protein
LLGSGVIGNKVLDFGKLELEPDLNHKQKPKALDKQISRYNGVLCKVPETGHPGHP